MPSSRSRPASRAVRVMFGVVIALFAMAAPAQRPTEAVLVTTAEALGGKTRTVAFDGDGSRALSAAWSGELAWWDAKAHTVLRSWPSFGRFVLDVAVHPDGDWALVSVARTDETCRLLRLDPSTGDAEDLSTERFGALVVSPDGRRVAVWRVPTDGSSGVDVFDARALRNTANLSDLEPTFSRDGRGKPVCFSPDGSALYVAERIGASTRWPLDGGPPVELATGVLAVDPSGAEISASIFERRDRRWSASPDGAVMAQLADDKRWPTAVVRLLPTRETWRFDAFRETSIDRLFASPTGEVWAADLGGLVHVLGPGPEDHLPIRPFVGTARHVAFSPDAKFLAIQTQACVRIVDGNGEIVHERYGTFGLLPGRSGSEFVFADTEGIEVWDAAAGQRSGAFAPYSGGRPRLWPLHGPTAMAAVDGGWVFVGGSGGGSGDLCRVEADGTVAAVPAKVPGSRFSALAASGSMPGAPAILVWGPEQGLGANTKVPAYLGGVPPAGDAVTLRPMTESVRRVRLAPNRNRVGILLGTCTELVELDATSLEEVRTVGLGGGAAWFEYLSPDLICCGSGSECWTVDATGGESRAVRLPIGTARVTVTALSADRRNLALGTESEVFWVRFP